MIRGPRRCVGKELLEACPVTLFPPPFPWKTLVPVVPERQYLAFTSRFAMRSPLRVPAFYFYGLRIMRQVEKAPGAVGYSLAADLPHLLFYTLSAWDDAAALSAFSGASTHGASMREFHQDMRAPSPFVHWQVPGSALPLTWPDALARLQAEDQRRAGG
jgi:hypothetical protein